MLPPDLRAGSSSPARPLVLSDLWAPTRRALVSAREASPPGPSPAPSQGLTFPSLPPRNAHTSAPLLCLVPSPASPRRRQWQATPVLLPRKSHGRRSLVGCSPWGLEESDTTERLHFHFSLSCIGEGNGNPLQCSCLENPRDGGACWAAICGVAQSWTRPKQLSSSSRKG